MLLQRFTNYLLSHRWQALALTFALTFIPVIGVIGILIAALITLVKGIYEGALFTLAATAPYFISLAFSHDHASSVLVLGAAIGVAVLSNVLTWLFATMLYRRTSWSVILQLGALLGVFVISVIHLIYPNVADWWGQELLSYYNQAVAANTVLKSGAVGSDVQVEAINLTKQYATGLMVAAILFNALLQLVVARWWQAALFKRGALAKELHQLRLSYLAGGLFIVSLILSYLGNSVVLDIMPVLYILFAAAGLSLIHYFFGLMNPKMGWFWLSIIYIVLILALPVSVTLVAIVALFDVGFDIRKRFKKV